MNLLKDDIVSVQWLNENLDNSNLIILNASIKKVTATEEESESEQIPDTRFFDIKNKFSDVRAKFPNTVPTQEQFTKEAQLLGINKNSAVVVYDDKGIYSSARAWYLFKAFGFHNVAVLNGGLPEWKSSGFKIEPKNDSEYLKGDFEAEYNNDHFIFFTDIKGMSTDENYLILDARSSKRFDGGVSEPRKGLRSGHIPNSKNLPFASLMNGNCLKPKQELKPVFGNLNKENKNLVFTCGSGITACILALAAETSGLNNLSVYDGSWTEYGSLTN